MKNLQNIAFAIALIAAVACENKETSTMESNTDSGELNEIFQIGQKGPAENFTGNAYNTPLVDPDTLLTTVVGNVYFEPGARSNWHGHPAGQILIITDGLGYHQIEGQPIDTLKKGDVITCPPNVNHWHGASQDVGLMQLYIIPNTEKGIVNWKQAVTDNEYNNN